MAERIALDFDIARQHVTRVDQGLGDQVDALLAAGGHRDVDRVDPGALGRHHFDDLLADQH